MSHLLADGATDVHDHLKLSGEPLIPELEPLLYKKPPIGVLEYQDLTLQGLQYEAAYSDYWNSTRDTDGKRSAKLL